MKNRASVYVVWCLAFAPFGGCATAGLPYARSGSPAAPAGEPLLSFVPYRPHNDDAPLVLAIEHAQDMPLLETRETREVTVERTPSEEEDAKALEDVETVRGKLIGVHRVPVAQDDDRAGPDDSNAPAQQSTEDDTGNVNIVISDAPRQVSPDEIKPDSPPEKVAGAITGAMPFIPGDMAMEIGVFVPVATAAHLVGRCREWEKTSKTCIAQMQRTPSASAVVLERWQLIALGAGAVVIGGVLGFTAGMMLH